MAFNLGKFDNAWYQNLHKDAAYGGKVEEECPLPPRDPDHEETDHERVHREEVEALLEEAQENELKLSTFMDLDEELPDLEERLPVMTASHFIEETLRIPNKQGLFDRFSFEGRSHLPPIYNTGKQDILLCCARQVEKCIEVGSSLLTLRGWIRAETLQIGDLVLSKDTRGGGLCWKKVTWISETLEKEAVELVMDGGTKLVCGEEHPIRTYQGWTKAAFLGKGDHVEVVSEAPELPDAKWSPEDQVTDAVLDALRLMGTAKNCAVPFLVTVKRARWAWPVIHPVLERMGAYTHEKKRVPRGGLEVHIKGALGSWLRSQHQDKNLSPNKSVRAGTEAVKMCVKLLWLLGGHIQGGRCTKFSLFYPHESLAEEARALHMLAGIETGLQRKVIHGCPQWVLRPQGRGVRKTWELLPPELAARYPAPQPKMAKDDLPAMFGQQLNQAWTSRTRHPTDRGNRWNAHHRMAKGISGYRREKARHAVEFLEKTHGADPKQVAMLRREVDSPTRWARVLGCKRVGVRKMIDFTVEGTGTFVANGVVTHNSTYLGNRILVYSVAYPGYKTLYVSPSSIQTKTFSKDRLANPIETSPFFRAFAKAGGVQNVLEMEFGNQSKITLRSAFLSADRCRGIAAYKLCIDEFQDILPEHLPVIEPCTSHAPENLRVRLYTGTPKSFDNNMEFFRNGYTAGKPNSTVGEWMVPCDHCGVKSGYRHWQSLGERNIKKEGLSCERCGGLLNPQHEDAQWVHQQEDGEFESYRIPQLMVPWRSWGAIWRDYCNFPKAKFYNEVLGLSMDDHNRPLSMMDIRACCDPRVPMFKMDAFRPGRWHEPIWAGIDWGSGTTSYTVLTLATYIGGIFTIFFMQRFTGMLLDVEEQILHILREMRRFNVAIVGTDFGYGSVYNDQLIRKLGRDRVAVYQHLGRVTQKVAFDAKVQRFKVFRSLVMADFINMIKRKNIRFPRWEDMREPFAQDFCNITAHLSETQQQVIYSHRQDRPDDSFHSALYAFLASTINRPRPDVLRPLHDSYKQGPVLYVPDTYNQGLRGIRG